ncbi:MAG: MaoC family dehydratase N-terminal domain-containing protein [Bdellovibrionales bacterium]|nr:MaoC family dehydratase N-terminal domain-containing protein [Bdellovibrionales bacterium]
MLRIRKLYFEEIELGSEQTTLSRTITEADIVNFACLSGDFNPLHMDQTFAEKGMFGKRIAHGLLGLSIAAGLQTDELDYHIQAFMNLAWSFKRPIFIGDTIYVKSKVIEKKEGRAEGTGIVLLERKVYNQNEKVTQEGTFQLLVATKP